MDIKQRLEVEIKVPGCVVDLNRADVVNLLLKPALAEIERLEWLEDTARTQLASRMHVMLVASDRMNDEESVTAAVAYADELLKKLRSTPVER